MSKIKSLSAVGIFSATIVGLTSLVYAGNFVSTYDFSNYLKTREFKVTSKFVNVNLYSRSNVKRDGRTTIYTTLYEKKWYGGAKVGATKSSSSTGNASHYWQKINNATYYLILSNKDRVWSRGNITVVY